MERTIKIGGEDRKLVVKYLDIPVFIKRWNLIYFLVLRDFKKKNDRDYDSKKDTLIIPNKFYFWIVWRCLVKRGMWPFRKPYRSLRKMIRDIRKDEFQEMVSLAGKDILEFTPSEEGREQGNVKTAL